MTLNEHLKGSLETQQINESLILAAILIAYCFRPLQKQREQAVGAFWSGLGSFAMWLGKKIKKQFSKKDKKEKDKDDSDSKYSAEESHAIMSNALDVAEKSTEDKKLLAQIETARACIVDKDGKPIAPGKYHERANEVTGDIDKYTEENDIKELSKEDEEKAEEHLKKEVGKKSDEEIAKTAEEGLKKSEEAVKNIESKESDDDSKEDEPKKDEESKDNDTKEEPKKTKVYQMKHNGKPDKLIKRPKKRGQGSTWCWASDKDVTVGPEQARAMLKKAGIKEGLDLSDWLGMGLD